MNRKTYIVLAFGLIGFGGFAQNNSSSNYGYLSCASFNTPSGASYFETYISIKGNNVAFVKNANGKFQAKVSVSIQFMQHDSVKKADAYNILSPETEDTSKKADFNIEKRYWLPHGEYTLSMKIEDKNSPGSKPISPRGKVTVGFSNDSMAISDVERILSYKQVQAPTPMSKSGIEIEPYVYNYYPEELKTISFYSEIYNTYKAFGNDRFAVRYYIESAETHAPLSDFVSNKVYTGDTVIPVMGGFNIEKLPSGKYNIVVAVVNKKSEIVISRGFSFYRNNPGYGIKVKDLATVDIKGTFVASIKNHDSLEDDVKCLRPVANTDEMNFIETVNEHTDEQLLRQFLYNFWAVHNPADPAGEWAKYYEKVKYVNKYFTCLTKKGYESDRGRVYLQYGGAPNQRVTAHMTPSAYPYEIWEYYKLPDGQVDKKFIFYEPSLSTNDFVLIHSTARGEVQGPMWQMVINSRAGSFNNVDQINVPDVYGQNPLDEYSNPR